MNSDEQVKPFNPRKNHLFIVGIDKYDHATNLENCVSDAEAFKNVLLEKYQFDETRVKTIYDGQATGSTIINSFQEYVRKLGPLDNLIIFISGHGYYDRQAKIGYLVPKEGNPNIVTSLIPHETVKSYLRGLNVHHCLLVVDSCYSGSLLLSKRADVIGADKDSVEAYALSNNNYPSRWGMAAGRIEKVDDGLVGDYSPYAKGIISFLTHNEYEAFATSDLMYHANRVASYNATQTPIGGPVFETGDEGGEFLFVKLTFPVKIFQFEKIGRLTLCA